MPGERMVQAAGPHRDNRRYKVSEIRVTYLVDANVLSEATKPSPDLRVLAWLRANEAELAVDPIILGEIRFGIDWLPLGRRRQRFERWFAEGVQNLVCLPIEAATGIRWAKLL